MTGRSRSIYAALLAALATTACTDAPTTPATTTLHTRPSADVTTSSLVWYIQSNFYEIVDETGAQIIQVIPGDFPDFTPTQASFELAFSAAGGSFLACVRFQTVLSKSLRCPSDVIQGLAMGGASVVCGDQVYPFAHVAWNQLFGCFEYSYNSGPVGAGSKFQLTAAPTAPGDRFFRRWEVYFDDNVAPCAEGTGSLTCTVTTTSAHPSANFKLVYGPQYPFTGFLSPVDNAPTLNVVKAGSAIPVKFSLGGDRGLAIFATNSPASVPVSCDALAPSDDVETTVTAGGSSLTYDATTGQYTYIWKTDKAWGNTCRELRLTLTDGSIHVAEFKFKK